MSQALEALAQQGLSEEMTRLARALLTVSFVLGLVALGGGARADAPSVIRIGSSGVGLRRAGPSIEGAPSGRLLAAARFDRRSNNANDLAGRVSSYSGRPRADSQAAVILERATTLS